jgi:hypothetical protein
LYKLSLFSLLESLGIPYITTDYMSLDRNEKIEKVEKNFAGFAKKVNENPNDESIKLEFMKWVEAGGKTLKGLVRRREAESELYFKK